MSGQVLSHLDNVEPSALTQEKLGRPPSGDADWTRWDGAFHAAISASTRNGIF